MVSGSLNANYTYQRHVRTFIEVLRTSSLLTVATILMFSLPLTVLAQESKRRYLFQEDSKPVEKAREKELEAIIAAVPATDADFDFKAPDVKYDQEARVMHGTGGVSLAKDQFQVQAQEMEVDLNSKNASLSEAVTLTWPEGQLNASQGELNYERETGNFTNSTLQLEQANYRIVSEKMYKDNDIDYRFFKSEFTTCQCPDDSVPWSISCSRANMRQDNYAHTYNTTFNVNGVPIFYSPYLLLPIKTTRQSGLLAPTYGYGSEDGFLFSQPLYLVLDDYSDATITPFVETNTRLGSKFDYRRAFSSTSNVQGRWYYSDESARDGDLRGTDVSTLTDKTFDEDRHGGFIQQGWQSDPDSLIPTRVNTDIHYVSDDLFLREIEDQDVGDRFSRYTTSQVLVQSLLPGSIFSEVGGEYNQAIETDDDLVFQRLPDVSLGIKENFRPFGYNPYGFKTVTGLQVNSTNFVRQEGFDGQRFNVNPSLSIPHHFQNYINAEFNADMYAVSYQQDEDRFPDSDELITDEQLQAYRFSYSLSSAIERVYQLQDSSWLTYLTSLGADNQTHRLSRVKHVVEPQISYIYTPFTDQEGLPLYDSTDRVRQRSLFSYGFRTSLLGKFDVLGGSTGITELTPELEDLPTLDSGLGFGAERGLVGGGLGQRFRAQRSRINEIAYFSALQSFDYLEDKKDLDPELSPFSDIGFETGFNASQYFGVLLDGNFDASDTDFSSWSTGLRFKDDRGDVLTGRYWFIDESVGEAVSQLDATLEISLTDRLKLGFYGRYDDDSGEFIESEGAFRIISACNCWYVDLGYRDTSNPNKSQGTLRFTFLGLGDLLQKFSVYNDQNQQ